VRNIKVNGCSDYRRLSEEELEQKVRAGDKVAQEEFIKGRLSGPLWNLIWQGVKNYHDASDIFQETCVEFFLRLRNLKDGSLRAYLFKIARSRIADYYRKKGIAKRGQSEIEQIAATNKNQDNVVQEERDIIDKEQIELVKVELSKLPEKQRCAAELRLFGGLSLKEIADILRRSPRTVRRWISRDLETIRRILRKGVEDK